MRAGPGLGQAVVGGGEGQACKSAWQRVRAGRMEGGGED